MYRGFEKGKKAETEGVGVALNLTLPAVSVFASLLQPEANHMPRSKSRLPQNREKPTLREVVDFGPAPILC